MSGLVKVIFYAMPFLVCYGIISVWTTGAWHIPDAQHWVATFNSLSTVTAFKELANNLSTIFNNVSTNFSAITDWNSFWSAIGGFFEAVGAVIRCFFLIVAMPIEFFMWLVRMLFPNLNAV